MKLGRLNHVGVATPSITASVAMYRGTMGLRKLRDKQLDNPWKKHGNIPL